MSGIMESSNQSNLTTVAESSVEQHTNSYNSNGDSSSQVNIVIVCVNSHLLLCLFFVFGLLFNDLLIYQTSSVFIIHIIYIMSIE